MNNHDLLDISKQVITANLDLTNTGAQFFGKLVLQADPIVKLVMLILVFLSIYCWAIILQKYFLLKNLEQRAERFDQLFWSGISIQELYRRIGPNPKDPLSIIFSSAMNELLQAVKEGELDNSMMKIERAMRAAYVRESSRIERNLGVLGTTASSAPFIGLFGTVWGIMNAFSSIALKNQTSLAVVAPGIAEALFATALGLFAAIPATIAYNKFVVDIEKYLVRLDTFMEEFPLLAEKLTKKLH